MTKKLITVSGAVQGSVFRYDVRTKAAIVNGLKKQDFTIPGAAATYSISETSLKVWYKAYYHSCTDYMKLDVGIMTVANSTVATLPTISKTRTLLADQESARHKFMKLHASTKHAPAPKLNKIDWDKLNGVTSKDN